MSESKTKYDTLHMGRSSIDLYSNDIGSAFVDIKSFAAYVGGSPTNISVGGRRLGLKTALLTGLGRDPVGDFILKFLAEEGVETSFICHKPHNRSSAVVLGIEPPDSFPLVYYRDNCADIELTIDDVLQAPVSDSKVFQFAVGFFQVFQPSPEIFACGHTYCSCLALVYICWYGRVYQYISLFLISCHPARAM